MKFNEQSNSQAALLGLQHLLAMYAGSILVPIMIASALGYNAKQLTYLIATDIFMCGIATLLQLRLSKHFGVGLPVVLGCAFQSVAPLSIIGAQQGSGYMFGALIASGIYVVLVAGIFSKVANFFPPIVTGSVITTIGLTLIPVAMGNMGDNAKEPSLQSLTLSLVTIGVVLLINIFAKGFLKSISILIGLISGTILAAFMGLVDASVVAEAPLVHIPKPFYFGAPRFEFTSILMMCIIATVSMVESTGVYLALSDFSQNVGLVQISGIRTRKPIYFTALFLVILGLLPKFGAMAQMIPSPVLGGAMLVLFGMVALQGMKMLNQVDFEHNEHNFIIAAVSIAAGVGFNGTNLFISLPNTLQMFLTNGIVISTLTAVVLNIILNGLPKKLI
ncbi:nucleobase:cation symporter-2 family protein [Streptococcus agalactiae]|uniref:nucleobase:cation symporter-2 family protein n=1 Tax=Streptococcus agalactiae TaxID=1311 RepID=UPI0030EC9917